MELNRDNQVQLEDQHLNHDGTVEGLCTHFIGLALNQLSSENLISDQVTNLKFELTFSYDHAQPFPDTLILQVEHAEVDKFEIIHQIQNQVPA